MGNSIADARTADVAAGMATMPRFEDGCTSLQELPGQLAESVVNERMSAEADQLCEATKNSRNGYRERRLMTCVGTLTLRIPKPRIGSFFPDDVLERYQRVDRAIAAAVAETCATGTSTRKARKIAGAMGIERLSKDQAGAIAASLGSEVGELLARPPGASCRRRGRAPLRRRGRARTSGTWTAPRRALPPSPRISPPSARRPAPPSAAGAAEARSVVHSRTYGPPLWLALFGDWHHSRGSGH